MGWVNKFWTACTYVIDAGVSFSSTILDGVGSLSAAAGGAGLAVAVVVDGQLNASYYGSAYTPGELVVGINVPVLNFNLSETIAFEHQLSKEGLLSFNSSSYLTPQMLSLASSVLIAGGSLLKVAGACLKKWNDYRDDKKLLKEKHKIDYLLPPTKAEYRNSSAEAALLALSHAAISGAVVGSVFSFSSLNELKGCFTYPSSGPMMNKSQHYLGPVTLTSIPVVLDLKQNTTLELPIVDVQLIIEQTASAKAVANVTYGGGVFFNAKNNTSFPVVVPATLAIVAHQASRFFSKKTNQARDERMAEARDMRYGMLS